MLVFRETHPLMGISSLCSSVTGLRDSLNIFLCHSVLDVSSSPAIRRLIRVRRVKIATAGQTRSYLWNVSVCVSALIKYIRPVFVSRSDQDSRRKTVEEIKRRARSGGEWPQVQLTEKSVWSSSFCNAVYQPSEIHSGETLPFRETKTTPQNIPELIRFRNKTDAQA